MEKLLIIDKNSSNKIEEILKIEDKDLQQYLFSLINMKYYHKYKIVNDDTKVGSYCIRKQIYRGRNGGFYSKNILEEWIVYNKKDKKSSFKIPGGPSHTADLFLDILGFNSAIFSIMFPNDKFITKSLIKSLVTGKINTIEDLMNHYSRRVLGNKNIKPAAMLRIILSGLTHMANNITNVNDDFEFKDRYISNSPIKLSYEELDIFSDKINKWRDEQRNKIPDLRARGVISDWIDNYSGVKVLATDVAYSASI